MKSNHISICLCTYRRNLMLQRLLKNLNIQETDDLFDFSIVIIDNDPEGSAREHVENVQKDFKAEIQYEIEKDRSIPAARNHAIRLAKGNYIAIIDDDEFPPTHWLLTLFKAMLTFNVDGALGPVLPYFEKRPPSWLIKGKLCERPIHRTGTILEWSQTRTGNVLLRKEVFDEHHLEFDLEFRTSSSDRAFFHEAIELGYKFVAVEEAPVYEIIPPERWTKRYYIRRALAHGYNTYRHASKGASFWNQIRTIIRSTIALTLYILALPLSVIMGTAWYVNCLEKAAHHLSQLLARLGIELIKKRDF